MPTPDVGNGYALPSDAVWFITGCSSGLGLSLAQLIAAHPTHRLVATARDPSKLKLGGVLPSNPRVLVVALDVTSTASINSALETVLNHHGFGRIDVLGKSHRVASLHLRLPFILLWDCTTVLS
jgi:NAD(P)-dependent dehydrogenase (short-subunit alcohol dehydrogenase family)